MPLLSQLFPPSDFLRSAVAAARECERRRRRAAETKAGESSWTSPALGRSPASPLFGLSPKSFGVDRGGAWRGQSARTEETPDEGECRRGPFPEIETQAQMRSASDSSQRPAAGEKADVYSFPPLNESLFTKTARRWLCLEDLVSLSKTSSTLHRLSRRDGWIDKAVAEGALFRLLRQCQCCRCRPRLSQDEALLQTLLSRKAARRACVAPDWQDLCSCAAEPCCPDTAAPCVGRRRSLSRERCECVRLCFLSEKFWTLRDARAERLARQAEARFNLRQESSDELENNKAKSCMLPAVCRRVFLRLREEELSAETDEEIRRDVARVFPFERVSVFAFMLSFHSWPFCRLPPRRTTQSICGLRRQTSNARGKGVSVHPAEGSGCSLPPTRVSARSASMQGSPRVRRALRASSFTTKNASPFVSPQNTAF